MGFVCSPKRVKALLGGGSRLGCGRVRLLLGITLVEAINASGGVHKLLLARKERVAFRADFHVKLVLARRACGKSIAAGALHLDVAVVRVNSLFHFPFAFYSCQLLP